jgi:hypothetical protein
MKAIRFGLITVAGRVVRRSRQWLIRLAKGRPALGRLVDARRKIGTLIPAPTQGGKTGERTFLKPDAWPGDCCVQKTQKGRRGEPEGVQRTHFDKLEHFGDPGLATWAEKSSRAGTGGGFWGRLLN